MHNYAIIVAGGKGERMGMDVPKQFLLLAGKPILMHTLEKFYQTIPSIQIILALPENQIDYWEEICNKYSFTVPYLLVKGGRTRFHSVQNALQHLTKKGIVAIHDGVRPLVSSETINTCFNAVKEKGNAIPTIDVVESLRHIAKEGNSNKSVARNCYKLVQTPQCFDTDLILKAYEQGFNPAFTDDASVLEKLEMPIHLVEGNRENIKITNKEDLIIAEALYHSDFC